jgi:integrase
VGAGAADRPAGRDRVEGDAAHAGRSWASIAEARGAKPREIQEALGHVSFETTLIYLHSRDQLERDPSQLVASAVE